MRTDYPAEADLELFEHAALNMVTHLQRDEARGVILIAYPPECILDPTERPVDEALAILERAASGSGIDVREALLVTSARWWSTRCNDSSCCPMAGTPLTAIGESRVAAEVVVRGGPMPFACEGDLIASLAHSDSLLAQCLEQAIEARVDELMDQTSKEALQDIRSRQRAALDECFSLWCQSGGNTQLFAGQIRLLADLVIGIQGIMLRDYALGIHSDESVNQAMSLWRWLLTLAPAGMVAPVACLTAATAYELGDGALAQRALDRAFLDAPEYSLAHLLRRVFTAGFAPDALGEFVSARHRHGYEARTSSGPGPRDRNSGADWITRQLTWATIFGLNAPNLVQNQAGSPIAACGSPGFISRASTNRARAHDQRPRPPPPARLIQQADQLASQPDQPWLSPRRARSLRRAGKPGFRPAVPPPQ